MKATGIVRRIDDLGRVVIPKEIRRTMRIREGDPLEIYTKEGGEVVFKKYSPVGELGSSTKQYANVLNRTTGMSTVICDRDKIIASSGKDAKELLGKNISPVLETFMEERNSYSYSVDKPPLFISEDEERQISVMCPIIGAGDILGAVVLLCGERPAVPSQIEIKLAQVAAGFLGKQMEE